MGISSPPICTKLAPNFSTNWVLITNERCACTKWVLGKNPQQIGHRRPDDMALPTDEPQLDIVFVGLHKLDFDEVDFFEK